MCAGLYHYCISCSDEEHSIVMKRLHIVDCYVLPYNHNLIKALLNRTQVTPIYKITDWWNFEEQFEEKLPNVLDTPAKDLLINHSLVPLTELYALSDPKKIKDINAAQIEYVSTVEVAKRKFKKIKVPSENSFELPGTGHFQILSSNVLRHKGRLNADKVLLVESALW